MLPKIRTILYCTQIGSNSAYVFRHALGLAQDLGATIHVLHVMETLSRAQEALVEGYVGAGTLHAVVEREEHSAAERLQKRIEHFCSREADSRGCAELVASITIAEGHKDEQILAHRTKVGADLVVMGAHAESSLFDALVGNTTQRVMRHCPVPVLVVQVPAGEQDPAIRAI